MIKKTPDENMSYELVHKLLRAVRRDSIIGVETKEETDAAILRTLEKITGDSQTWRSVDKVDFKLLAAQKEALVESLMTKKPVPEEVLDGLVNFLDAIMDEAEENGLFEYENK